jgi:hypothetical protein
MRPVRLRADQAGMWTAPWGQVGIDAKIRDKRPCIAVDGGSLNCMDFWKVIFAPVDRLLTGRHESNQPSNNH